MKIYQIICTFFYIGLIKIAPGTFGSLAAFPVWFLISDLFSNYSDVTFHISWFIIIFLGFFLGSYYSDIHAKETGKKDAGQIVIDEVIGQLLAIFISFKIAQIFLNSNIEFALYFCFNFIIFRLLDITKPSLIGLADKKIKGGYGVMIDDILAGLFTGLIIIFAILVIKLL